MRPVRLGPNQPRRFYRGGSAIARFRGTDSIDEFRPEDWVGSTIPVYGGEPAGLCALPDERLLRDAVRSEPDAFLGEEHMRSHGADPAVLVKLLHAGEPIPVHVHPDVSFARDRLGAPYGKAEAWLILATEEDPATVYIGFRSDVDGTTLADWVQQQDRAALLDAMHELRVAPGDCIFVPAGTPHAIGAGIFMVEVQEPSDLSILLDWSSVPIESKAALVGLDLAGTLPAVRHTRVGDGELASWRIASTRAREIRSGARTVVPAEAERFFRAEWLRPEPAAQLEAAYAIVVIVAGEGELETDAGELQVTRGDTILVPYAAGAGELRGAVEAIRCLPPRPAARES